MKTREQTLRITLLGVFSAVIILMTLTPLGYISVNPVSVTLIHIPVIVGAIALSYGKGYGQAIANGGILGGVMGLTCMYRAAVFPSAITDPLFVNPLLSLFPRIILGMVAAATFLAVRKFFTKKPQEAVWDGVSSGIAAAAATLTNTVLVLSMIGLIYGQEFYELEGSEGFLSAGATINSIFLTIIGTNGVIELISAVIITVPAAAALFKLQRKMFQD